MMNELMQRNQTNALMFSDPAAVAAAEGAKARIQAAYYVAINRPRSYDQARVRILKACRRPDFAEKVEYSKPVGGKSIVGPSIRFAELALREWGNVFYENQVVYDDENVRRVRVVIIDLETNTTYGKEIQMAKTVERRNATDREVLGERVNSEGKTVYTVRATEDELLTREAALISKALRNEGLRLIPQEIVEESIREARSTVKNADAMDPDAAKNKMIDLFYSLNVGPADLEKYLKHPIGQTSTTELGDLRKIYTAIREGEAKWSDFANRADEPDDAEKGQQPDLSVLNGTAAPVQPQRAATRKPEDVKASVPEKPLPEEKIPGNPPAEKVPEAPRQTRKTAAKSADDDPPPFFATNGKTQEDTAGIMAARERVAKQASMFGWSPEQKKAFLKTHNFRNMNILVMDFAEIERLSMLLDEEEDRIHATESAKASSLREHGFSNGPEEPLFPGEGPTSDENGTV